VSVTGTRGVDRPKLSSTQDGAPPAATMRILHLIPSLGGGGAERQLTHLVREQVRRGHVVAVATHTGGVHEPPVRETGAEIVLLRHGHRAVGTVLELLRVVRRLRPHVVHTWLLSMDVWGGVVAHATRTCWILCERSNHHAYPDSLKFRLRRWLGRRASAVIANSQEGREYWAAMLPDDRCFVAGNAVDHNHIGGTAPALPAVLQSLGDRPLVLFAGRFGDEKNLWTTLRAFEAVAADVPAVFALCGDGPLAPAVREAVERGSLAHAGHVLGYRTDVISLLKASAVFVSLSRFEGQPNAVTEAMAAGCPLVVSDIPAHRELLDPHSALFVDCDDAEGAAACIRRVLRNPEEARSRADAARAAAQRFTPQSMADSYEAVYRRLICAEL
jgi:glycosyltransferase involved in cell wall biosynthesis